MSRKGRPCPLPTGDESLAAFEGAGEPRWARRGALPPWDSSGIGSNPWAQTPFERRKPSCLLGRDGKLGLGGIWGLFSSGGPSVLFLTRYDGEVSEPLVGRQGSRVSMRVARGSASLLPGHGRGIWPRDVLKKVSRGLSRVEAGNPGFPRLVQVTSGGFSWWL